MAYPYKRSYSGTSGMDPQARRQEASRIVDIIQDYTGDMTPAERNFTEQMGCDFTLVSDNQLFWLRDIKDKYAC